MANPTGSKVDKAKEISVRKFTPASFHSRHKRRRAEKQLSRTKTANSFRLMYRAIVILRGHWEVFGGIFMILLLINTLLTAGSLLQLDLSGTKSALQEIEGITSLGTGLALFGTLLSAGAGSASGAAGAYQMLLFVVISLATVWALRQVSGGSRIRVRDAFYNSSYPLVQILLLLVVLFIHLLPALTAAYIVYSLLTLGIIIVGWQQALVVALAVLLFAWSIYLVTATIIALYIVTLPDMTPLKALRSARELVKYRRALVFRKLLFLPVTVLLVGAIILIPLSLLSPLAATVIFFLFGMAVLPLAHAYIYMLYRDLIA